MSEHTGPTPEDAEPITDEQLAAWEALADASSDFPELVVGVIGGDTLEAVVADITNALMQGDGQSPYIVYAFAPGDPIPWYFALTGNGPKSKENADFIAAARTALPRLVAAVRGLTAEVERLREQQVAVLDDYDREKARAARLEAERAEWVKEREGLRQIAVSAKDYLDCLAEFTDTAAGNLSDCCQEYLQHLDGAVDVWRVAAARDAQEGQGG